MTVLVVTAVESELDAVIRDLGPSTAILIGSNRGRLVEAGHYGELHAFFSGVGPTAAAVTAATLLALGPAYELVISAGVAGGFRDRAAIGDLVLASGVIAADQGAVTDEGFLSLRDMGLPGNGGYAIDTQPVAHRLEGGSYRLLLGRILTLSSMTGTQARAAELAARYPDALAEAMEGYGVLEAQQRSWPVRGFDAGFAEIRAISNVIGRRDRSTWDLPTAFDVLASAFATLTATPPESS
jgi:futalosine hydrolase